MCERPYLGAEFGWPRAACERSMSKASAYRGLVGAVADRGMTEAVARQLPEAARETFLQPPLSVTYIPSVHFHLVMKAIDAAGGHELLRDIGRDSILQGPVSMMRPLIEGTLRLFEASPAAFYKMMPKIIGNQAQDMTLRFEKTGARACELLVQFDVFDHMPPRAWVYWEGVLLAIYDLCSVEGTCTATPTDDPRGRAAIFHCAW